MKSALQLKPVDAATYSPLALAYIGDAVYELLIRTRVVNRGSMQVNKMHNKSASLVKAETQANLIKVLQDTLTPQELAVYKRGRNARSASTAKNATMIDYRMATGFEAMIGYLYLKEEYERLLTLVHDGLEKIGEFYEI
ncbi:MAG: Mini-ribonuclease 3 [Lachnospiraceae bacterium]